MAYEALENLQQTLDLILHHRDDLVAHSIKQETIPIHDLAVVLQLNLKHYPNKERIREAATETHEILEYLFSEEDVSDALRLANRLRKLSERFESTVGDVVDCIMGKQTVGSIQWLIDIPDISSSSTPAFPTSSKHGVVGFEEDLKVIKDWLLEESSNLKIIPIVGTGGIGKTTLAKAVYNDALVKKSFTTCAWVTVSQDSSIVSQLLASLKGISAARYAESMIHSYLGRRRYLIVIDDVWCKEAWDDVKMLFPDNLYNSRIIVTTRLQDVAAYVVSSSSIHTMRLLDANHSWNLLKQKVFADKDCPIELEDIGKKIVRNCGGLPLAIVAAAGLLSKIHTRYSWKVIAANGAQLETMFCLSYNHSPNHSKAGFLYMDGFPKDYEIRVSVSELGGRLAELVKQLISCFGVYNLVRVFLFRN